MSRSSWNLRPLNPLSAQKVHHQRLELMILRYSALSEQQTSVSSRSHMAPMYLTRLSTNVRSRCSLVRLTYPADPRSSCHCRANSPKVMHSPSADSPLSSSDLMRSLSLHASDLAPWMVRDMTVRFFVRGLVPQSMRPYTFAAGSWSRPSFLSL